MFHDGWFWLAAVETIILLGIVGLFVWALRSVSREARVDRQPSKPVPFTVEAKISPKDGEVHIDYDHRVTGVSLNPTAARYMADKIHVAADVAESPALEERAKLPTAWDRIKGGGRL